MLSLLWGSREEEEAGNKNRWNREETVTSHRRRVRIDNRRKGRGGGVGHGTEARPRPSRGRGSVGGPGVLPAAVPVVVRCQTIGRWREECDIVRQTLRLSGQPVGWVGVRFPIRWGVEECVAVA